MGLDPRHFRQSLLPEIQEQGQLALRAAHAMVVGCGALGCVAAEMLCRAGVGTITIVDRDVVEATNLQRQVLFDQRDAIEGTPKVVAAAARLAAIDDSIRLHPIIADVTRRNIETLLSDRSRPPVGVIVDGTDNFETRYLLNDAAVKLDLPLVYAGVVGTAGLSMTIIPRVTACLRCVFDEPPATGAPQRSATCDTVGVLGPAVGVLASFQAAEAIKILAGRAGAVRRSLLSIDVWSGEIRTLDLTHARRDDCPCCARGQYDSLHASDGEDAVTLCGRGSIQITPASAGKIDLDALALRLQPHGSFIATRFLVRGSLDREQADASHGAELKCVGITVFRDGRAIVSGAATPERARALYARYVGA